MWDALLAGMASGFILGSLPGGVVFSIIQHSIDLGWKKGVVIATGVVFSDLMLITFVNLSTFALKWINDYDLLISLAGICLLLILGINNFFTKKQSIKYPSSKVGGILYLFTTGFMLNTLNPVNFFMWIGITTQIHVQNFLDIGESFVYFGATLASIFLIESLISYFAGKLRVWITPSRMGFLNNGIGIIFIILAFKLGWNTYLKHF